MIKDLLDKFMKQEIDNEEDGLVEVLLFIVASSIGCLLIALTANGII